MFLHQLLKGGRGEGLPLRIPGGHGKIPAGAHQVQTEVFPAPPGAQSLQKAVKAAAAHRRRTDNDRPRPCRRGQLLGHPEGHLQPPQGGAEGLQPGPEFPRRRKVQHRSLQPPAGTFGLDVPGHPVGLAGFQPRGFVKPQQAAPARWTDPGPLKGAVFPDAVKQPQTGQSQTLRRPHIPGGHRGKDFGFFLVHGLTPCQFGKKCGTIS